MRVPLPRVQAALEEGVEIAIPQESARVETVGQFKQLVRLTEGSQEFRLKVCVFVRVCADEEVCYMYCVRYSNVSHNSVTNSIKLQMVGWSKQLVRLTDTVEGSQDCSAMD